MEAVDTGKGQTQALREFCPEIVLLYCRQALLASESPLEGLQEGLACRVRLTQLPCSSKMDAPHLLGILAAGADGVQVIVCPDQACRFLVGNDRAERRINYARELLQKAGVGGERLGIVRQNGLDIAEMMELAAGRASVVRALGPNPTKGD